jgi:zinc/manganese transport system ATP-binding protein
MTAGGSSTPSSGYGGPVNPLEIRGAALRRGDRELWAGLDLSVAPGELVAVLGPSGSGKTTLLRAVLGLERLSEGSVVALGEEVRRAGNRRIGYVPQQRPLARDTALRGRDVVQLGVDGHRFGLPIPRRGERARVAELIRAVGAEDFADRPVGLLSGGEQQRLRVGQALADDPKLLLCDEPLTSLDLANQQAVVGLIDRHRRRSDAAVLFVTHDINPVLGAVDRILYLANGRFTLGTPDEVLDSDVLSELYGAPVFVLRAGGRLVVVGAPDAEESSHHHEGGPHDPRPADDEGHGA